MSIIAAADKAAEVGIPVDEAAYVLRFRMENIIRQRADYGD